MIACHAVLAWPVLLVRFPTANDRPLLSPLQCVVSSFAPG